MEVTREGYTGHSDKVVKKIKCHFDAYRIIDSKIITTFTKFKFAYRQSFSNGFINFYFKK